MVFLQRKYLIIARIIPNRQKARLLTALAFPGIVRGIEFATYPTLHFIEQKYIRTGKLPIDYTIGDLQMRLRLVEQIDELLKKNPNFSHQTGIVSYPAGLSEQQIRRRRLERMQQFHWQLKYLHAFYKIVMQNAPGQFDDELQKLYFFASAYYSSNAVVEREVSQFNVPPEYLALIGNFYFYEAPKMFA
ncbi:MAG: hypothetical protein RMJ44_03090 [Cytophagales bacterium]|nr:hypothetical protein [Bernardetiaceae bacterium]MDW8210048.1 hypothetical protein [Cytophagales bacterium]